MSLTPVVAFNCWRRSISARMATNMRRTPALLRLVIMSTQWGSLSNGLNAPPPL